MPASPRSPQTRCSRTPIEMGRTLSRRNSERGQTILLVAVSLVALLGLVALAIDVVTLYVARSEAQRAADAAALAGAKMLVDAGVTSDPCNSTLATNAQTLAQTQGALVGAQNNVAGQAPTVVISFPNGAQTTNCPNAFGINPQAKAVVTRTGLPTFFARIWSQGLGTVSATATAEAYNPSNSSSLNASAAVNPIAPRCIKPMLLPNCDPNKGCGTPLVDPTTGAIQRPGTAGVVGEQFTMAANCNPGVIPCTTNPPTAGQYYPIVLDQTALHLCPACSTSTAGFQWDLECCNGAALACGQQVTLNTSENPNGGGGLAVGGGRCLINFPGNDLFDPTTNPISFIAESNNPFVGSTIQTGDHILNSQSVVTVPIYDSRTSAPTNPVTIIGFLQLFINTVGGNGQMTTYVLNVSGCGNAPSGVPIQGSGTSVPVRLIQAP